MRSLIVLLSLLNPLLFTQALPIGERAPILQGINLDNGQSVALQDYKGRLVLLEFWASWCVSCQHSLPMLGDVYHHYQQQGVEILSINLDSNRALARDFVQHHALPFTTLIDIPVAQRDAYQITALPSVYLVGREGKLLLHLRGSMRKKLSTLDTFLQEQK